MHPAQRRPREGCPESVAQEPVQRTHAQRSDPNLEAAFLRDGQLESFRVRPRRLPPGEQKRDPLLAKSPPGERQHRGRRSIEPLHIVHCNQNRFRRSDPAQETEQSDTERVLFRRRPLRVPQEKSDLERAPLRLWESWEPLVQHVREQVADHAVRERRLLLGRARPQNAIGELAPGIHPGAPERRLADSGLTLDQQHA